MKKINIKNKWLINNIEPCDWSNSSKYKNYLAIITIDENKKEEKAFLPDTKDTDKYFDVTDVKVDDILCASCWNARKSRQQKVYYVVTEKTDDYIELDEYTTFRKALKRDKLTRKEKIAEERKDILLSIGELIDYGYCKENQNQKETYLLHYRILLLLNAALERVNTLEKDNFIDLLHDLVTNVARYVYKSFNNGTYEKNPKVSEVCDFISEVKKTTKLLRKFYRKNGYIEENLTDTLNKIITTAQMAEKDEKTIKSLESLRVA